MRSSIEVDSPLDNRDPGCSSPGRILRVDRLTTRRGAGCGVEERSSSEAISEANVAMKSNLLNEKNDHG
jgi:hypothetical protein